VTAARQRLGTLGEDRAAAWYIGRGYEILARNWRCRDGEIDLVCSRHRHLVICEVKARSSLAFGHPAEAVTAAKAHKVRILAAQWLAAGEAPFRPQEIRFDVAAVLPNEVSVIEAAF
jgi:putative endonuclease